MRDTKLDRSNHDATPKHQGNLKRFLRDLHRGHERDEREKQRAKDEVARLNGEAPSGGRRLPGQISKPSPSNAPQASPAERRRQLEQLASMGVAIPEEFRKGMVMAGDWQVLSETPIYEERPKEESSVKEEDVDQKPTALNTGVRKRPHDTEEEEISAKKRWVPPAQTYPKDYDEDLDALLASTASKRKPDVSQTIPTDSGRLPKVDSPPHIKKEASVEGSIAPNIPLTLVKGEEEPGAGIVFRKRKSKAIKIIESRG